MHVWVSRGTSGKSRGNPRGAVNGKFRHSCVELANLLAARFALCVLVCLSRQVFWCTEQPVSSVAQYLPYLEVALYPAKFMIGFAAGLFQKLHHVSIYCRTKLCCTKPFFRLNIESTHITTPRRVAVFNI